MDVSSHTQAEEHTLAAFTEKGILYVVHRLSVGRTRGLALEIFQPEPMSTRWGCPNARLSLVLHFCVPSFASVHNYLPHSPEIHLSQCV